MWKTQVEHGRDHVENISSVCWGYMFVLLNAFKLCSQHSTGEFKSIQQRSSNQFTLGSHCASYKYIHLFTQTAFTHWKLSSSSMIQSTMHAQENQLKPVFSLLSPFPCCCHHLQQNQDFQSLWNSITGARHTSLRISETVAFLV